MSIANVAKGTVASSPIVNSQGGVCFGADDFKFYCSTGATQWNFTTQGPVKSTAASLQSGSYIFGSNDGSVYKVGGARGEKSSSFSYNQGGAFSASPAIADDGRIYIGNEDGFLYALDANLLLLWRIALSSGSQPITSSVALLPVTMPDVISMVVGSGNSTVYGLRAGKWDKRPKVEWKFVTGGPVVSTPAVSTDGAWAFVGSDDGKVYCLDTAAKGAGSQRWFFPTGGKVQSSPALSTDGTAVFVASEDAFVYALDAVKGTQLWKKQTGGAVRSSPVVTSDNFVYVVSSDGLLYSYSGSDGYLQWTVKLGDPGSSSGLSTVATASSGFVYAINNAGRLVTMNTAPSGQPTASPSRQPSSRPSRQPSRQPSSQPSRQPVGKPSGQPTTQPSCRPSAQPTSKPSGLPSAQPTSRPSRQPSGQPSATPTRKPTSQPSDKPTRQPTSQPSRQPTRAPTGQPTRQPSRQPTSKPTSQPSCQPTRQPTRQPTTHPSAQPSSQPSRRPSSQPTEKPSRQPSSQPSSQPTAFLDYLNDGVWQTLNATTRANAQDPLGVSFGATAFKDVYAYAQDGIITKSALATLLGGTGGKDLTSTLTCPAWRTFATSSLLLPFDNVFYSSISVSGMSRAFGRVGGAIIGRVTRNFTTFSCLSTNFKSGAVPTLARFLSKGTVDGPHTFTCGGVVWRYQLCKDASPALCINCKPSSADGSICSSAAAAAPDSGICWGSASVAAENPTLPAVFMNPCQDGCSAVQRASASSFAIKFGASLVPLYPRFNSLTISAAAVTKTSVTVVANLTLAGTLYCAPFYGSAAPASVGDIQGAGFAVQTSRPDSIATLVLSPLQPQTNLTVFCATVDFQSHFMDMATVLRTGVVSGLATKCCRAIVWTAKTSLQKEADNTTDPRTLFTFSYSLQTPPTIPTTVSHVVSLNTSATACKYAIDGTATTAMTVPNRASYLPNSRTTYSGSFSVVGTPGCYIVSLSVASGGTNFETPRRVSLILQSTKAQPGDPKIISAQFSPNGAKLLVSLDSPTDRGLGYANANPSVQYKPAAAFNCSLFLRFPGAALGLTNTAPSCLWQSSQLIVAQLNAAPVMPGDVVTLLSTRLKPCPTGLSLGRCQSLQFASTLSAANVVVSASSEAPVVRLSTAKTIGSCDSAQINALSSFGNAGRAWLSVRWSVSAVGTLVANVDSVSIARHLNNNYNQRNFTAGIDRLAVIPSTLAGSASGQQVMVAGTYTISLTLTNFLGLSSTGAVSFSIQDNWLPLVLIQGPSIVQLVDRSSPLNVVATASIPDCAASKLNFTMGFSWTLFSGLSPFPAYSISADPKVFSIPGSANVLKGGAEYTLRVASAPSDPRLADHAAFATVTVQVGRAQLKTFLVEYDAASATGSTLSRTVTRSDVVSSGQPITLKTAFQDIDVADNAYYFTVPAGAASSGARLAYGWSCIKNYPFSAYGQDCGLGTNATYRSHAGAHMLQVPVAFINDVTVPILGLSFTVNVRETLLGGVVKTSSSSFALTIRSDAVPQISPSPTKVKYAAGDKILLEAGVSVIGSAANVTWSTAAGSTALSVPLGSIAAVPTLSTLLAASSKRYSQVFQLPLLPNSLNAGMTYSFTLTAQYSASQVATSTFSVVVNAPPAGGLASVLNDKGTDSGTAMVTAFLFKTFNWVVDATSLPVSYTLASYSVGASQDLTVLKPLGADSFINTTFPLGLATNGFKIFCLATAQDSFGASASAPTATVVVTKPVTTAVLQTGVIASLTKALASSDSAALLATAAGAASVINAVDCGTLTEESCSSLYNRHACKGTALTCGACLDDYRGRNGDSNTACANTRSRGSESRRKLGTDTGGLVGSSCDPSKNGKDCATGYCAATSTCIEPMKACPSDCSGHGECRWFNSHGARFAAAGCSVFDDLCVAKCECSSHWHGGSCNKNIDDSSASQRIIDSVCSLSYKASLAADVTRDALLQQAAAVTALFADAGLLPDTALRNCTLMLVRSVASNPDVAAASAATTSAVMGALDAIAHNHAALPSALFLAAQNATIALTAAAEATLGIDETPLELVQGYARIKTAMLDAKKAANVTVAAPLTSYEAVSGKRPATVSLRLANAGQGGAVSGIGVTLVQFTNNPAALNTTHSSTPITVKLSAYASVSTASSLQRRRLLQDGNDSGEVESEAKSQLRRLSLSLTQAAAYSFSATLQNVQSVDSYFTQVPVEFEVKCYSAGQVVSLPLGCGNPAGSGHTCSHYGTLRYTCATQSYEPQCLVQGDDGSFKAAAAAVCTRVAYSPTSTTCQCSAAAAATGRRRLVAVSGSFNDASLTVASQGVLSGTVYSSVFVKEEAPTAQPTPTPSAAPTSIVATLSFQLSGVSLADANTASFKLGVAQAVAASVTSGSLASVSDITVAVSAVAALARRAKRSLQTGAIAVTVNIVGPGSGTAAAAALLSIAPSTLLTNLANLASNLGLSASTLSISTLVVAQSVPSAVPTVAPTRVPTIAPTPAPSVLPTVSPTNSALPPVSASTSPSDGGVGIGTAIGGAFAGIMVLGLVAYWAWSRHTTVKSSSPLSLPQQNRDFVDWVTSDGDTVTRQNDYDQQSVPEVEPATKVASGSELNAFTWLRGLGEGLASNHATSASTAHANGDQSATPEQSTAKSEPELDLLAIYDQSDGDGFANNIWSDSAVESRRAAPTSHQLSTSNPDQAPPTPAREHFC